MQIALCKNWSEFLFSKGRDPRTVNFGWNKNVIYGFLVGSATSSRQKLTTPSSNLPSEYCSRSNAAPRTPLSQGSRYLEMARPKLKSTESKHVHLDSLFASRPAFAIGDNWDPLILLYSGTANPSSAPRRRGACVTTNPPAREE
jgi:hypothetical protein